MTSAKYKEGYKMTKLGWIPEDWEVEKLGDLFSFRNGINASKDKYGSGTPFINVSEILKSSRITLSDIPGEVNVSDKILENNIVKYGDILFNRTSETPEELGMTAVYLDKTPVTFGGFVIKGAAINDKLNICFRRYVFHSSNIRSSIIRKGQGAVRSNIGQKDLEKILIPLPPLPEQKKIADILSTWDKAITQLNLLIAAKEEQKKGLMQRLLTGRVRLKGFSDEWKEVRLGEVFTERKETGYIDLELLSIGSQGVYPQSQSNKKDNSNSDKSKYKRICPGDIGYNTMRMWQGRSALSHIEGLVSPAYTVVTTDEENNSKFYSYLFKLPRIINLFFRYSQGLVKDTLNCKFPSFSKISVRVPSSLNEQIVISKLLDQFESEILAMDSVREKYSIQKKGLMQQLLTGRIRVKI